VAFLFNLSSKNLSFQWFGFVIESGSDLGQTHGLVPLHPGLIKSLDVKTFMALPCRDLCWISKIELNSVTII
jgi:hypothetical protein